jgi:hypothetical protein
MANSSTHNIRVPKIMSSAFWFDHLKDKGLYSDYSVPYSPDKGGRQVRLKLPDFRMNFRQGEEGDELELQVRRSSLRPDSNSMALLRHHIAHELALGVCQIRQSPAQRYRRGPVPILEIPLSDEHLPSRGSVLNRVKAVIVRLGSSLKVVSPRHLKPKRAKTSCHERPIRRRTRPRVSCGGYSA